MERALQVKADAREVESLLPRATAQQNWNCRITLPISAKRPGVLQPALLAMSDAGYDHVDFGVALSVEILGMRFSWFLCRVSEETEVVVTFMDTSEYEAGNFNSVMKYIECDNREKCEKFRAKILADANDALNAASRALGIRGSGEYPVSEEAESV